MEINGILRGYQMERSEALTVLHKYLPIIVERFYGELPLPALSWEPLGRRVLGSYREADGLMLSHRIALNSMLAKRPIAVLTQVLAHELGHLWQHLYGKPAKAPYHNKQFQEKMKEIGIPCSSRGYPLGVREPFVGFLKELGVEGEVLQFKQENLVSGKSRNRLRPWSCGCTKVWVSVWTSESVELKAKCLKCGSPFQRQ